ncbi:MAG: hypothetical protein ACRDH6_04800 [Actinomycetota bacterium]
MRTSKFRRAALILAVGSFVAAFSGPAFAQYPINPPGGGPPGGGPGVPQPTIETTGGSLVPGDDGCSSSTQTVSGSDWQPHSTVVIEFIASPAQVIGRARVNANGDFSTEVSVPASGFGTHTIRVRGFAADGSPRTIETTITCLAQVSPGVLAFTGANITVGGILLLTLVVIGTSTYVAGRRREGRA